VARIPPEAREVVAQADRRDGDFSSNWITTGLPTTRTSALTLYAS
jgi:hypothetical protein